MSYAGHASTIGEELLHLLPEEEVQRLHDDLIEMGADQWRRWDCRHETEANDFLRSSPGQRAKKKKWQDPVFRRRLILSAYRQTRLAAAMLEESTYLQPIASYRDATAAAALAALQVLREFRWRWPFGGAPPFPEWR
jgi:hypothetical protein